MTALVLVASTVGAAVRFSSVYSRRVSGGIVALLLAVAALLVWTAFRNQSICRQRALTLESVSKRRE